MDLFEYQRKKNLEKDSPLASKIRPTILDEFVGQEHIVGEGRLLNRAIKADKLSSIIFCGPPGTGKTTLARIIANSTKSNFIQLNATTSGVKDLKEVIADAKQSIGVNNTRTILFIDEIHRFNKSQQDTLLPHTEDGTIVLIGATTENPYFEVNKALVSRSIIFQLEPLEQRHIKKILLRVLKDKDKGFGKLNINFEKNALDFLSDASDGDARKALNALELAVLTTNPNKDNEINISLKIAEECIQKRGINYDKNSDNHYDTISAFIKSMRGSDPDAAVYYLGRMLYAGEDPKFIARRIIIAASEDVGNADPHALQVAVAAADATNFIGLPEARIILAQAAIYIACAPKSNAVISAIDKAMNDVQKIQIMGVPYHLRDRHYEGAENLYKGHEYLYPHSYPGNYVKQQYLPDELINKQYYKPSDNGVEKRIKKSLEGLYGERENQDE